jgi:hypothetical protein
VFKSCLPDETDGWSVHQRTHRGGQRTGGSVTCRAPLEKLRSSHAGPSQSLIPFKLERFSQLASNWRRRQSSSANSNRSGQTMRSSASEQNPCSERTIRPPVSQDGTCKAGDNATSRECDLVTRRQLRVPRARRTVTFRRADPSRPKIEAVSNRLRETTRGSHNTPRSVATLVLAYGSRSPVRVIHVQHKPRHSVLKTAIFSISFIN